MDIKLYRPSSEFRSYQHIERLGTSSIEGLTNGICHIFPKLDGTNASIWWDKTHSKVACGCRTRELSYETPQQDNYGFCAWVNKPENLKRFTAFFVKYTNCRLYGEWLVPHTIKTYKQDAWCNFYVFDVFYEEYIPDRTTQFPRQYVHYDEYSEICDEFNITYIPRMAQIENPTKEQLIPFLYRNTYCIDVDRYKGERGLGEGIVIKQYGYKNKLKCTKWGKLILADFQTATPEEKKANDLLDDYLPNSIIQKAYVEFPKEKSKCQEFAELIWEIFLEEEAKHFLKDFKGKLNVTALKKQVFTKARQLFLEWLEVKTESPKDC